MRVVGRGGGSYLGLSFYFKLTSIVLQIEHHHRVYLLIFRILIISSLVRAPSARGLLITLLQVSVQFRRCLQGELWTSTNHLENNSQVVCERVLKVDLQGREVGDDSHSVVVDVKLMERVFVMTASTCIILREGS